MGNWLGAGWQDVASASAVSMNPRSVTRGSAVSALTETKRSHAIMNITNDQQGMYLSGREVVLSIATSPIHLEPIAPDSDGGERLAKEINIPAAKRDPIRGGFSPHDRLERARPDASIGRKSCNCVSTGGAHDSGRNNATGMSGVMELFGPVLVFGANT